MRRVILALLALSLLPAWGDNGDDDSKGAPAHPQIRAYWEAQCKRNDECEVQNFFDSDECVAICEGFTIAFGDCKPNKAVIDACIEAIEATSCEDQKADKEPEECQAICG